eukprot:gene5841-8059_t
MNPFFVNPTVIFDHFDAVLLSHDRMIRRTTEFNQEVRREITGAKHNKESSSQAFSNTNMISHNYSNSYSSNGRMYYDNHSYTRKNNKYGNDQPNTYRKFTHDHSIPQRQSIRPVIDNQSLVSTAENRSNSARLFNSQNNDSILHHKYGNNSRRSNTLTREDNNDYNNDNSNNFRNFSGLPGIICKKKSKIIMKDWEVHSSLKKDNKNDDNDDNNDITNNNNNFNNNNNNKMTAIDVSSNLLSNQGHIVISNQKSRLESLKQNHDYRIVEIVMNDMISYENGSSLGVTFNDIAALDEPKRILNETVILPLLVPELFTGIREPWKGILLFGPPGTGKTMLAKAIAHNSCSAFFNCSASSLISKWRGESEKIIKCLFDSARICSPSIIFIDEVDSLVSIRGEENEHEASRRMKSEFFSQMDGLLSSASYDNKTDKVHSFTAHITLLYIGYLDQLGPDHVSRGRVMVLCTSNCPWDLDTAILRRLEKRIYIHLPDLIAREEQFNKSLLKTSNSNCNNNNNDNNDIKSISRFMAESTEGYSCADIQVLIKDAAMAPVRRLLSSCSIEEIQNMRQDGTLNVSQVRKEDFEVALARTKPSVSQVSVLRFKEWNDSYGSS